MKKELHLEAWTRVHSKIHICKFFRNVKFVMYTCRTFVVHVQNVCVWNFCGLCNAEVHLGAALCSQMHWFNFVNSLVIQNFYFSLHFLWFLFAWSVDSCNFVKQLTTELWYSTAREVTDVIVLRQDWSQISLGVKRVNILRFIFALSCK